MSRNRNHGNNFPTGNPNRNRQNFDEDRRQNFNPGGDPFRGQHAARQGHGAFGRFGESLGNRYESNYHQNARQPFNQGNYRGYAGSNPDFVNERNENRRGQNYGAGNVQPGHPGRNYGYGEASYPKGGGRNYEGMNADYRSGEQFENYGAPEGGYGIGSGSGQYEGTQGFGRTDFEDYGTSRAGRNYGGIYDNAYNYETGARNYEGDMRGGWREGSNYGGGYGGGTRGGGPYGQGGFGSIGGSYSGSRESENYGPYSNEYHRGYHGSNDEWDY